MCPLSGSIRWQSTAIQALQGLAEAYLVDLSEGTDDFAVGMRRMLNGENDMAVHDEGQAIDELN